MKLASAANGYGSICVAMDDMSMWPKIERMGGRSGVERVDGEQRDGVAFPDTGHVLSIAD